MAKKHVDPIELDRTRPLWEMQDDEPVRAFQYFRTWLDMGADRNIERLRSMSVTLPIGKRHQKDADGPYDGRASIPNAATLELWSRAYCWNERLRAWAQNQADVAQQAQIEAVKEMALRHTTQMMALQELGMLELGKHIENAMLEKNSKKPNLSVEEIRKLLDTSLKWERLTRGVPDSITENQNTGPGGMAFEKLPKEKRVQLLEQYAGGKGPSADGPGYAVAEKQVGGKNAD